MITTTSMVKITGVSGVPLGIAVVLDSVSDEKTSADADVLYDLLLMRVPSRTHKKLLLKLLRWEVSASRLDKRDESVAMLIDRLRESVNPHESEPEEDHQT